MNPKLQSAVNALVERFNAEEREFRGDFTLIIDKGKIVEACRNLRDEFGFEMLKGLTAVDYWPQEEPRFHVLYLLHSLTNKIRLSLRVPLNGHAPSVPTVEGIYSNANWHERETWDLFGINFEGHSDLRRIMLPDDWEGHPLRKDYPIGHEEIQHTHNFDEIENGKQYAKE